MKTPPLLLFATLAFWGWQSQLLVYGLIGGALIELSRVVRFRWDLDDADFHRIWSFCTLLVFGLAAYVFTTNDSGGGLTAMFQGGSGLRAASTSSTVATTSVLRWLPFIFFPFIIAQVYNARPTVPLTAVSLVLRLRRRRGEQSSIGKYLDVSYPYFIACIFAAGIHANQGTHSYFWGHAVLIVWALWTLRTGRFGFKVWLAGFVAVLIMGFVGDLGINQFERALQNFDARMIAAFFHTGADPAKSVTAMGEIGELKLSPRIVIRLQPDKVGLAPSYLREASYRSYNPRNQTWLALGGGRENFSPLQPQSDGSTWVLIPNKKPQITVGIACYLNGKSPPPDRDPEGVLPLPSGTCQLGDLPTASAVIAVQTNQFGAVMVTGSGLLMFNAKYGPGATLDSLPDPSTNHFDLFVPTNEMPALKQVISEMSIAANASDKEKRLAVEIFLGRNFTYSTWQKRPKDGRVKESPLTRFLVTTRSGHCEYFATSTVLLLRQLGIPARYAVGYSVHEAAGSGYVVRERDAHAWCLAWNDETKTWEDFDTTPASWVAVEDRGTAIYDFLSDVRSWVVFQLEKLRWRQAHLRQYIFWTIIPVMVVLVYYIIFQRRAKTRATTKKSSAEAFTIWPGHDSAFYRLEKSLTRHGLPRQPQELLSTWLERILIEPSLANVRTPVRELLQLHYRYRFDPAGLSEDQKHALVENTNIVLKELEQLTPQT